MNRRQALGFCGAAGFAAAVPPSRSDAGDEPPAGPPRITVEELRRRVKEEGFDPESLYAHEVEFRGVVEIKRDVPLFQIKGMDGSYSKVHLYGGGGNVDVGSEMEILGLIVDHGYGALMVWLRKWKYADA